MKCVYCNGTGIIPEGNKTRKQNKKEVIKLLFDNGYTYREICKITGIKSTNTIHHYLKNEHQANDQIKYLIDFVNGIETNKNTALEIIDNLNVSSKLLDKFLKENRK